MDAKPKPAAMREITHFPLTATLNRKFLRKMLDGEKTPVPEISTCPQQSKFLTRFRALMNRPFRTGKPKTNVFLGPYPTTKVNFGRTSSGMFNPWVALPPGELRTRVEAELRLLDEPIQVRWDQRRLERGTAKAKAGSRKAGRL